MKFAIITHVPHIRKDGLIYAYGPYVKEMNLWAKYVDEIIIVAPVFEGEPDKIQLPYEHAKIEISRIPEISLISFSQGIRSFFKTPTIKWKIFNAMRKADHIHLRCPGNIGLIGCFMQIFFPKKSKTAKYAGNWDPNAKQPWSYRLQKWLLSNTILTRNMQVLVYGEWPDQSKNVKSFFTASYTDLQKVDIPPKSFDSPYKFIFVGSLAEGKRPLYAIKLVEALIKIGEDCILDFYGEGPEREKIESYTANKGIADRIKLHGNQTAETVEFAYKSSDFLLLPSRSEGWPKVVAEAMFWGAIPVVTKISCVPFMLADGERGILIDNDLEKDTALVKTYLEDSQKLIKISEHAMAWSRLYTLDRFEVEIAKLLKQ